jgi:A/G-specific adenine glycosylase
MRNIAAEAAPTNKRKSPAAFSTRLLRWFEREGRHDLPWQHPRTPYRVWLSEVMLQQTQVATVIPYFERFVRELPTLPVLAAAPLDRVLALWSGLGYYSRARNLHRAAQRCCEQHGGDLPGSAEELAALPGIGRSTAAAILAQAHGQRHAILDGNVRRVLARHAGVAGDVASAPVQQALWQIAEGNLPRTRLADYTQAIMDIGATLCTRSAPACPRCPLAADCVARMEARTEALPQRRSRRGSPTRGCALLVLRDGGSRVLLERRPPTGVWGGLWSVPECPMEADPIAVTRSRFGLRGRDPRDLSAFKHVFTHFILVAQPRLVKVSDSAVAIADNPALRWVGRDELSELGLAAPIRALLERIFAEDSIDAPHRVLRQAQA